MGKYRKKPIVIEASQWFKNGDHPQDECEILPPSKYIPSPFLSEGKIVRYYRHPQVAGDRTCDHCGKTMHHHGWIDTLEGGHIVCPSDWVITGVAGERYPCKDEIFRATYEPVSADEQDKE